LLGQVEAIKSHGMFFLANSGDRKLATCATRDIAAAAKLLPDDSWSGPDSIPVLGPDDLSPKELAQIASEAWAHARNRIDLRRRARGAVPTVAANPNAIDLAPGYRCVACG